MRRFSAWSVWLGDSGQCFQELSGMCSRERGNCICAEIAQKWQHLTDLRQYNFSEDPKYEAYTGVPRDFLGRCGLSVTCQVAEGWWDHFSEPLWLLWFMPVLSGGKSWGVGFETKSLGLVWSQPWSKPNNAQALERGAVIVERGDPYFLSPKFFHLSDQNVLSCI